MANEKSVLEKLKSLGGVQLSSLNQYFSEDEGKIILDLIDRGLVKLEDTDSGVFIVPVDSVREKPKEIFANIVPQFFEDVEEDEFNKKIIEFINSRNVAGISNLLANRFISKYNVKTFLTDGNRIIGIFGWDGKRYINVEELAKKYVEEVLSKYEDLLIKAGIKKVSIMKEYMFKVTYSNFFKVTELPLISFRNCVIRWDAIKFGEGVFLEFNPNLVVFNYVDFDIDIDGLSEILKKFEGVVVPDDVIESYAQKMCPNSLRIFKEWVGDKWILLFEIIGYTLYPKYTFNKAVMLVGEGNNGKSTYIRLIKEILGQENTVSISLQTLCENIFAFSQLYRKLANLFADLPSSPIRYTGIFKLATGEDTITADRKFKDPITFENYAKLIFSANILPNVSDMTLAFWRRWLVIEFKNQFKPVEGFFEKNFTYEEMRGVVNVSILAFRNVLLRCSFSFERSEADYKEIWLRKVNNVYAFIQDAKKFGVIEEDPLSKVETSVLYDEYVKYCEGFYDAGETTPVSKKQFTEELERLGYNQTKSGGKRFYRGIRLIKSFKDISEGEDILSELKAYSDLFGGKIPKQDIMSIIAKKYENPESVFEELVKKGYLIEAENDRFMVNV